VPRCSVVIPAYNAERYVAAAIQSVLDQTFTDFEVIVVNDGSTDGTAAAVEPFGDRVVYVEQENKRLAGARNAAVRLAKGEFVAPLDADDMWPADWLERTIGYLDAHPEVGAVTHVPRRRRRPFRWDEQLFWIGQYNFVPGQPVIRRRLLDEHGLWDESLFMTEDWELWMRFIAAGERFGAVAGVYPVYRRHPESGTADLDAQSIRLHEMLERVATREPKIPGLSARLAVARGRVAIINRDFAAARRHFLAAVLDSSGAVRTRLPALPFAVAPSLSWRLYRGRVARFRRRGAKRAEETAAAAGLQL